MENAYRPDSIYATLRKTLCDRGLFDKQADGVMALYMEETKDMEGRWNDRASDYPSVMMPVLLVGLNKTAVSWIDKNAPLHWARPMFTGELNEEPKPSSREGVKTSAQTQKKQTRGFFR